MTASTMPAMAEPMSPLERQQLDVASSHGMTYWHRVRFELLGRRLDAAGATRVLDIGAGSGLLGDWLRSERPAVEYRFVESSSVLRDQLADRFGAGAEAHQDGPIPTGTLVALLDVVEHIDDDAGTLAALHGRMAPGSHLLVTVPAMQWAFSSWDERLGHHRRYSRPSLRRLLRGAGFADATTTYLFPELFPLLVARQLRRSGGTSADFPPLPPLVGAIGYRLATATAATRRLWPFGTSVVATATRGL